MWIVVVAWLYVALTMSLAEATNPQGTILGAVITFVFYGIAPLALVMYLMGTPARRKARRAIEAAEHQRLSGMAAPHAAAEVDADSSQRDAGSLPARDAVTAERKET